MAGSQIAGGPDKYLFLVSNELPVPFRKFRLQLIYVSNRLRFGAAIVDQDHLKISIILCFDRRQRLPQIIGTIKMRHAKAHQRTGWRELYGNRRNSRVLRKLKARVPVQPGLPGGFRLYGGFHWPGAGAKGLFDQLGKRSGTKRKTGALEILWLNHLRNAPNIAGQKRNLSSEAFQNSVRQVIDQRWHNGQDRFIG